MRWVQGHPPQNHVENNGEGQEDHGDSTACLGDASEGLHGGLVQDGPLDDKDNISWRAGPCTLKALDLSGSPSLGRTTGGQSAVGCYQQQGEEG